jgi:hydroxymethylpyrimidine pyrophosphatase-like HAD family hydrolase
LLTARSNAFTQIFYEWKKPMDLVVFDLDGTLLNGASKLSPFTIDTLGKMNRSGVAFTVATGRTFHGAIDLLDGHGFQLPHIYKNGVVIWHPKKQVYTHRYLLIESEIRHIIDAFMSRDVCPFIFTLDKNDRHAIYHPPLNNTVEERLAEMLGQQGRVPVLPVSDLPGDVDITNISAIAPALAIDPVAELVACEPGLISFTGDAIEDKQLRWIDIHHHEGNKGAAISTLKHELGVSRVLCFGDSDNDLSMFIMADEAYAPLNAKAHIKDAATDVIGHHDKDGVAKFLVERYSL